MRARATTDANFAQPHMQSCRDTHGGGPRRASERLARCVSSVAKQGARMLLRMKVCTQPVAHSKAILSDKQKSRPHFQLATMCGTQQHQQRRQPRRGAHVPTRGLHLQANITPPAQDPATVRIVPRSSALRVSYFFHSRQQAPRSSLCVLSPQDARKT